MENPVKETAEDASLDGVYARLLKVHPEAEWGEWEKWINKIIDMERENRATWIEKQDEKGRTE